MITLCLNVFIFIVGMYLAIRLAAIAMDWIKEGLDMLSPSSRRNRYRR